MFAVSQQDLLVDLLMRTYGYVLSPRNMELSSLGTVKILRPSRSIELRFSYRNYFYREVFDHSRGPDRTRKLFRFDR